MKLAYFPSQVALNGTETLNAFLTSARKFGFEPVANSLDADAVVIWSVLWHGRLKSNHAIYEHYRKQGKNVFILEVGSLRRGYTWKVAVNNITRDGIYANRGNLDPMRSGKIGVTLAPVREKRRKEILIACQHFHSQQWAGQPVMSYWVTKTIEQIRRHTDRPIVVRMHPRAPFSFRNDLATIEFPKKLSTTSSDFDFDYGYHCIVNHNSGPSVLAPLNGTPVICDTSSLAWPMTSKFENIENVSLPDREQWFIELCHTEWTNQEIEQGEPLSRIMPYLNS